MQYEDNAPRIKLKKNRFNYRKNIFVFKLITFYEF